ncbi:lytic transglycosylase domain-containing protein [Streptomyces sp. NPDC006285]|uniref:lytic transglycosylase domain-containing protein n=1 Tax=Streptomyces sp. NPDC006285 TaxID=3364742 RepID=UPI0036CC2701
MGAAGTKRAQTSGGKGMNTALVVAGAGAGFMGCLFSPLILLLLLVGVIVICAIGVVFWPLVMICQIFGCGGGSDDASVDSDKVAEAFASDGKGELIEASVPSEFLKYIQDAGKECDQIGPIVIAAQIQQESMFNAKLVGPDGAEGISQLPPDKFDEFGEDDDDSDETSALDAGDSIMAQGRYMCSLAKDIDTLVANNELKGKDLDKLDLTLAAYHLGLDEVKKAKGVPDHGGAQSYIFAVRTAFGLYAGAVELPEGETYPSVSPLPLDSIGPGRREDEGTER